MSGQRRTQAVDVVAGPRGVETVLALLPDALAGVGPALCIAGADDASHRTRLAVRPTDDLVVDDDVAVVLSTSGSTGDPRGVLLPAGAVLASARATLDRLGGPGAWTLALPVTGIAGLQVLVRSLVGQCEPEVLASVGGATPFSAAAFAAATWRLDPSVPAYTALVPTQAARLLDSAEGTAALQSYDAVLLGGARTPPALLDRLRSLHVAVLTTYGMTETSGGLFYDGRPIEGAEVRIEPGADGVGRIVLGGPMVARGYVDGTASAFVDGWHVTNDVGRVIDGRLEVLGRADDVVQVGGVNVAASAVEDALVASGLVREACVLAEPDEEWGARLTAYVVGASESGDDDALAAAVSTTLGRAAVPRRFVRVDGVPLLPTGKPDREALRRLG